MYTPGVGVVWDSLRVSCDCPGCAILPTQTSQWIGDFSYHFARVASTSRAKGFPFLFFTVAVILLLVGLLLIALVQRALNSLRSSCACASCIVLQAVRLSHVRWLTCLFGICLAMWLYLAADVNGVLVELAALRLRGPCSMFNVLHFSR